MPEPIKELAAAYCPRCRKQPRTTIGTYPEHKGGALCGPRVEICAKHGIALIERKSGA